MINKVIGKLSQNIHRQMAKIEARSRQLFDFFAVNHRLRLIYAVNTYQSGNSAAG